MNRISQLKLLIWKNWQIQKKHKLGTAFEIGLPIFVVLILVVIRAFIHSKEQCMSKCILFVIIISICQLLCAGAGVSFRVMILLQYSSLNIQVPRQYFFQNIVVCHVFYQNL